VTASSNQRPPCATTRLTRRSWPNDSATSIAPTILLTLGLDPQLLDAVKAEGTQALPGLGG
jgi:hypothetical protein